MPTATSFVSLGWFPHVPSTTSPGGVIIDNISLADMMAIFWNTASFDLAFTGTASTTSPASTVTMTGTYSLDPAGFTGSLWDEQSNGPCVWLGDGTAQDVFANAPSAVVPRERLNAPGADVTQYRHLLELNVESTTVTPAAASVNFYFTADPTNSGKYRFHYAFNFEASNGGSPSMRFTSSSTALGTDGYTTITSGGTFTLFGLTLTYYSGYIGDSYTGGTMSGSSSVFTY